MRPIALALLFAVCVVGHAVGHDLPGLMEEHTVLDDAGKASIAKIEAYEAKIAARIEAAGGDLSGLEGVVDTVLAWRKDVVTGCFFGGGTEARDAIAKLAASWLEGTRLSLDFGPEGDRRTCDPSKPSNIRVGFSMTGHWSYVGASSKVVKGDQPTLNLAGFGSLKKFSTEQSGIILHEFGHAFGFKHEHQSPNSSCDKEFDWDHLYATLPWPKEKIDHNMKKLLVSSRTTLIATEFDPESAMLYYLGKAAYKDWQHATCYIARPNTSISAMDRETIVGLYPPKDADAPDQGLPVIDDDIRSAVDGIVAVVAN